MKDERIQAVKNWLKPKFIKDIKFFLVLLICINISSKASVKLPDYSAPCFKHPDY